MSASRGWNQREYSLALPDGMRLPPGLPPALAELAPEPPEDLLAGICDYPQLRRALHALGLTYCEAYTQDQVAQIIGRTQRTVRSLALRGKIHRCYSSFGAPFFKARDIEDYLARCAYRPRNAAK